MFPSDAGYGNVPSRRAGGYVTDQGQLSFHWFGNDARLGAITKSLSCGGLVKRLRRWGFIPEARVRFPYPSPCQLFGKSSSCVDSGYPGHDIKPSTLIAVQPNRLRHQPLKLIFSGSSPDTATTPPHRGYRQTHPGYDAKLSVHSGVLSNGQDCAL